MLLLIRVPPAYHPVHKHPLHFLEEVSSDGVRGVTLAHLEQWCLLGPCYLQVLLGLGITSFPLMVPCHHPVSISYQQSKHWEDIHSWVSKW